MKNKELEFRETLSVSRSVRTDTSVETTFDRRPRSVGLARVATLLGSRVSPTDLGTAAGLVFYKRAGPNGPPNRRLRAYARLAIVFDSGSCVK